MITLSPSLKILWSEERVLLSYFLFRRLIMINSTSYLVMTEKTKEIFRGLKVKCKERNSVVLRTKYRQNHMKFSFFPRSRCVYRCPSRTIMTVKQSGCHCCCVELHQDLYDTLIRYCTEKNNKDWEKWKFVKFHLRRIEIITWQIGSKIWQSSGEIRRSPG